MSHHASTRAARARFHASRTRQRIHARFRFEESLTQACQCNRLDRWSRIIKDRDRAALRAYRLRQERDRNCATGPGCEAGPAKVRLGELWGSEDAADS